ncbi:hypothetical protein [Geodermatophilus sp. URMC 64]
MKRARLLVVPAAGALLFSGMAPATADPGPYGGRVEAYVVSIGDVARADADGEEVWVKFKYKCRGDDDRIRTTVRLRQDGARFRTSFYGDLYCNGHRQTDTVRLDQRRGSEDLENGYAEATVSFDTNRRNLDYRTEPVWVRGVQHHDY